jgi:flagellar motor switch/type III secretory pathway protein FliN
MSALQRKAQAGRKEHQARAMTVPKALRLSIAKVADDLWEMALAVIGITLDRLPADALDGLFDENALLLLLDGPDGATGAAIVGQDLVNALIQQQTTGRVSPKASAARRMTGTDAALCAPLLDAVFARAHSMLETGEDRHQLPVYRFGARSENPRLLKMALEEAEYSALKITIDVASGAHQASVVLLLPVREAITLPKAKPDAPGALAAPSMEDLALSLPCELRAILCRIRVPVSKLGSLQPGMTLALPPDAFPSIQVETIAGRAVATGELGQLEGQRALRLDHRPETAPRPQRRVSDQAGLDRPDVTRNGPRGADAPGLIPPLEDVAQTIDMVDLPSLETMDAPSEEEGVQGLPDLDLPDLDGLPDLSDIPNFDDLPDLDLDDLPDLGALPDLNSA